MVGPASAHAPPDPLNAATGGSPPRRECRFHRGFRQCPIDRPTLRPVHVGPLVYRRPDHHHLDTDWPATPPVPGSSSHQIARNGHRTPLEPFQGTDRPRHSRASRRPPGPRHAPASASPGLPPLRPLPVGSPCVVTHPPSPVPPGVVQCVQECASHGDSPWIGIVFRWRLQPLRGPCVVDTCAARRIGTELRSYPPGSPDTISASSRPVRCGPSWGPQESPSGLVDLDLHRRTGDPWSASWTLSWSPVVWGCHQTHEDPTWGGEVLGCLLVCLGVERHPPPPWGQIRVRVSTLDSPSFRRDGV